MNRLCVALVVLTSYKTRRQLTIRQQFPFPQPVSKEGQRIPVNNQQGQHQGPVSCMLSSRIVVLLPVPGNHVRRAETHRKQSDNEVRSPLPGDPYVSRSRKPREYGKRLLLESNGVAATSPALPSSEMVIFLSTVTAGRGEILSSVRSWYRAWSAKTAGKQQNASKMHPAPHALAGSRA